MEEVGSANELASLVGRLGACHLFKKKDSFRLYDSVRGRDSTVRRRNLLQWTEQAHLKGEVFLSVDRDGSLMVLSRRKFSELRHERSVMSMSEDERRVLRVLSRAMPTPLLRRASGLPTKRFDRALTGLRYKMRVALVGVKAESTTKFLNVYDRIDRYLST